VSGVEIDRLVLRLSGVPEGDGQRLARLIAQGLGRAGSSIEAASHGQAMQMRVTPRTGAGVDDLAEQVVEELLRELKSSSS
jgi:hypothetical protein